jgi:hypothetical protein
MTPADHDFDPDTNFHDSVDGDEDIDLESTEGLVWQLLLLINPGDEDMALTQFSAYRETVAGSEMSDEAMLGAIKEAIDWRSGFHVEANEPRVLIESINELCIRWNLVIDWGGDPDDDDFLADRDVPSLLNVAFDYLTQFNYTLWTWQTGSDAYAGWMTLSAEDELMRQIAGALNIDVRPASDAA